MKSGILSFRCMCLLTFSMLAVVPLASSDYTRINAPNPNDAMDVHIYQLDNGLTVYLSENHETPRFYAQISVRAGSKHDPADSTGLAHYLEHLLFKGTARLGTLDYEKEKPYIEKIEALYEEHFVEDDPEKRKAIYAEINRVAQEGAQYSVANEIDKVYKSMGGAAVNAHTSNEETVYKVSLPSNRLEQWATVESERFINPVFRLFHTELETVYEEKNRSIDNKSVVISDAVDDLLYKRHQYGQQSTIGTVEHLKRPSLVTIQDYFERYYVPNNMAITISGDINIEEAIAIIDDQFSSWESKRVPKFKKKKEKKIRGVERISVNYKAEEYILLGFRTVSSGHKDNAALSLADMILDNAQAGLVNLNLNQQQLVRGAGTFPRFMNDYGAQYLWGIPKDGQTREEVEGLLLDQLELLKNGDFDEWILEAIVTDFKKGQKGSLESDTARVSAMTRSFIAHEDWDYTVGDLDRMAEVTKADVVRVANKYFGENYVAGYRIDEQQELPSIDKPKIDPVEIDPSRQSAFAKDVLEMPFELIEPVYIDKEKDLKRVELPEGITVLYSPNPLNDLFSFRITVEVGTYENGALSIATRLLGKSGAGDLSAEELKKEWYRIGCDNFVSSGRNQSTIGLSGLDENFEKGLALLMKKVMQPTADDDTLDELKKIILAQREDAKKNPGTLLGALTLFHRYGEESTYLQELPSAALNALTVEELHNLIRQLLDYKQTITYTGSLSFEEFTAILKKHHPIAGKTFKDTPPYRFLKASVPEKTEIYFLHKEMAQAQVRIEFPDNDFDEANHTPIELYNSYFAGGMSGIVFQELRESRALAYSASAAYSSGGRLKDENLVIGVIGCQADKTPEAVAAFLDLFDNLPESEERFAESVDSLTNRYRTSKTSYRGVIGSIRSWERHGFEDDPRRHRFENLQRASLDDMMQFHKTHIQGKRKMITIVGDRTKVGLDALAEFGDITEFTIDDLFVE